VLVLGSPTAGVDIAAKQALFGIIRSLDSAVLIVSDESGLMLTGRMASVLSGQGQNMIFTVFAACVIGRISLNGGRGSILGALCGVILLGIISNILTLSNIQTFWISATYGAIILLSLILTRLTSGKSYRSD
jgi:simple sugar transport system permease protein